ncbi:MAG: hypothetical protein LBF42_01115, partial [Puniceicoccales bacterium]|nr:hypothetical protein [Puniceicoccales bacterium]
MKGSSLGLSGLQHNAFTDIVSGNEGNVSIDQSEPFTSGVKLEDSQILNAPVGQGSGNVANQNLIQRSARYLKALSKRIVTLVAASVGPASIFYSGFVGASKLAMRLAKSAIKKPGSEFLFRAIPFLGSEFSWTATGVIAVTSLVSAMVLNRITSYKFPLGAFNMAIKQLIKLVQKAIIPTLTSAILVGTMQVMFPGVAAGLLAKPVIGGLVKYIASRGVSPWMQLFITSTAALTVINRITNIVNKGFSLLVWKPYIAVKTLLLQAHITIFCIAATYALLVRLTPLLVTQTASLPASLLLYTGMIPSLPSLLCSGAAKDRFIRIEQVIINCIEWACRSVYHILQAESLEDLQNKISFENDIFLKRVRILQRPQKIYNDIDSANLNKEENYAIDCAINIALVARAAGAEDYDTLKGNLEVTGLILIEQNLLDTDHFKDSPSPEDPENREKITRFLSSLKTSNGRFRFENGNLVTDSGLKATLAYDPVKKVVHIFYHGTDFKRTKRGEQTMWADADIILGENGPREMADDAIALAQTAKDEFGDKCRLSGHSLGGGLCQIASAHTQIPGVSINPAPVNEWCFAKLPRENLIYAREHGIQVST